MIKKVVNINNIKTYNNIPVEIKGIEDNLISKVPVILQETDINITINSIIKLMDDIEKIDSVRNKLIIDKTRVLKEAGLLNISGRIRKTVYYKQRIKQSNPNSSLNTLKHFIVYIPFNVDGKLDLTGLNLNDMNSPQYKIYCEPVYSKIVDYMSLLNIHTDTFDDDVKQFFNIISLFLRFDILQDKLVSINPVDLTVTNKNQPTSQDFEYCLDDTNNNDSNIDNLHEAEEKVNKNSEPDIDHIETANASKQPVKDLSDNSSDDKIDDVIDKNLKFYIPKLNFDKKSKRTLLAMLLLRFFRGF